MVLPEDLCNRLSALAEQESRTVSNMAKVLIQEGIERYAQIKSPKTIPNITSTERFRSVLEAQESKRLKGTPRRFRLHKPY